jgi:GT2 family glycosyltransferase
LQRLWEHQQDQLRSENIDPDCASIVSQLQVYNIGDRMDVSIIIINYNTIDLLRNCLNSICAETRKVDYEVFVVDNASSDGSVQMVENDFPDVILIKNHKNVGFAKANNQAMELCTGKYVLLLNSDTLILNNTISKMVTFMDQNPHVGLACCKLLNPDGTLQINCRNLPRNFYKILVAFRNFLIFFFKNKVSSETLDPLAFMYRKSKEVNYIVGAFMMVRNDVINEVGKLDENFFIYGEDNDWCIRVQKSGWRLWYFSGAEIIHYGGESFAKCPSKQVIDWQFESEYYLLSKHNGRIRLLYWYFSSLIESLVKAGIYGFFCLLPVDSKKAKYAQEKYKYFKYKLKKLNSISMSGRGEC